MSLIALLGAVEIGLIFGLVSLGVLSLLAGILAP